MGVRKLILTPFTAHLLLRAPRVRTEAIHSTKNVITIPADTHQEISALYSSKQLFSEGQTVRQWLVGQSFRQQRKFGLKVLRDFGVGE